MTTTTGNSEAVAQDLKTMLERLNIESIVRGDKRFVIAEFRMSQASSLIEILAEITE